ncbi:hypothetical protein K402DRAFT_464995 [Aulographum hederae CBS 113979]|uniref:RNA polymerase II assembly factor Rtp1 C-terminal domain-containing protein n=1 Tax=Aulographum hederae CBS 113979 TaxID=1176131 RepID=A0A6G1GUX6_9PEZI|nr:hypothetical protein K402DRAFT_464995 [Aulographum hederae CBS 113979]
MASITAAVEDAASFLSPLTTNGDHGHATPTSVLERLASSTASAQLPRDEVKKTMVRQALQQLQRIDLALVENKTGGTEVNSTATENENLTRIILQLLDLLLIEAIYPRVTQGIGIREQRRKRSSLYTLLTKGYLPPKNVGMHDEALDGLLHLMQKPYGGVKRLLQNSILTDMAAATSDAAFHPSNSRERKLAFKAKLDDFLNSVPVSLLFPSLTALASPNVPEWLRLPMTEYLARLPLRPDGVRQTFKFVNSAFPPPRPSDPKDQVALSKSLPLAPEALELAVKLLTSAPRAMPFDQYITDISGQFIELLDGGAGQHTSNAVGYIISTIFGKKSTGAPGSTSWKLFAEPLFQTIGPNSPQGHDHIQGSIITAESELRKALNRVLVIVHARPNTGVTRRLIAPILLPLWGLLMFAKSNHVESFWSDAAWRLLVTYCKLCGDAPRLERIVSNLSFQGHNDWTFTTGKSGGVEIKTGHHSGATAPRLSSFSQMANLQAQIEARSASFVLLASESGVGNKVLNELLVNLIKTWLLPHTVSKENQTTLGPDAGSGPLKDATRAKVVQDLLTSHQWSLTADPELVIELVRQLLQAYLEGTAKQKNRNTTTSDLYNVLQPDKHTTDDSSIKDTDAIIVTSISVLTALAGAPDVVKSPACRSLMGDLLPDLKKIIKVRNQNTDLDVSLRNIAHFIKSGFRHSGHPKIQNNDPSESWLDPRTVLRIAVEDLNEEFPTERSRALSIISRLSNSVPEDPPVVDTASITTLVIELLRVEKEEFVYLAAIRLLEDLSETRDPRTILNLLLSAFADPDEQAVDEDGLNSRLRFGESIAKVTAVLPSRKDRATQRPLINKVVETLLMVASRRGQRKITKAARDKKQKLEQMKEDKRARERKSAWGEIEPPSDPTLPEDDETENETEEVQDVELEAYSSSIIAAWTQPSGLEEDPRMRASALSLVSPILKSSLEDVSQHLIQAATEVSTMVLKLEPAPEKSIIRRAAVLVFLSLLHGLDSLAEDGRAGEVEAGVDWVKIEQTLEWTRDGDEDGLVRKHAEDVLESLAAFREKAVTGAMRGGGHIRLDLGLEGGLRGLSVRVDGDKDGEDGPGKGKGRGKRLVEEVE